MKKKKFKYAKSLPKKLKGNTSFSELKFKLSKYIGGNKNKSQGYFVNPQPKESWEEKLGDKINYITDAGFELGDYETADMLIGFIKNLLEVEYERGRHDNVIDISTWKNLGEKRGYDKFFKKNLLEEQKREIIKLNKISKRYAKAISLMADGVPYEKLPKNLK